MHTLAVMGRYYRELTPEEAQAEFERFVGLQPEWANQFVELVEETTGNRLDFTVASIEPAWQFVLDYEGDIGHDEPDPWMTLNPYARRNVSTHQGWKVGLFAAYRFAVLEKVADTRWFVGNKETQWRTAINEPILQVGDDHGTLNPAASMCSSLLKRVSPAKILAHTEEQVKHGRVKHSEPGVSKQVEPLYVVEQFYDDVNLTYCEEILDSDTYHPFLDHVHEQFVKRFGPGMYLENYKDSFYVEKPSDIAETIRIVTEIAQQAGDPR